MIFTFKSILSFIRVPHLRNRAKIPLTDWSLSALHDDNFTQYRNQVRGLPISAVELVQIAVQ